MESARHEREPWFVAAAAAIGAAVLTPIFLSLRSIPDLDSYYHLAVARLYASHGLVRALPWARFSLLGVRLGDKELFFHLLLIPFSGSPAGGRGALLLLNLAVIAAIGWIAARAAGPLGAFAGLWAVATAGAFFFRTFRLRPELLSLILLLAFVWFLARRRAVAAGVVCLLYPLCYTAWEVPIGLAIIVALATRDREWRLVAFPAAGTLVGVLVHPHFADNVRTFWVQNVLFFSAKHSLDVGNEIGAPDPRDLLLYNLGFWIGLALLIRVGWRLQRQTGASLRRETIAFGACGLFFGMLFLFMERMAIYAVPLLLIAAAFYAGKPARWTAVALAGCVLISGPWTWELLTNVRGHCVDEHDLAAFGSAVPPGTDVAAPWGAAEAYCYWAPGGRYLNVLDPIYMALPHPKEFAAQRAIFAGSEPDIPYYAQSLLGSSHLAFRAPDTPRMVIDRLRHDPRVELLHGGENILVRFRGSDRFVGAWDIADPHDPRRRGHYLRGGYVDLSTLPPACIDASAVVGAGTWELASWGPAMTVEGLDPAARTAGNLAILGGGVRVDVPAPRRITIRSCRDDEHGRRNGFYFVRR